MSPAERMPYEIVIIIRIKGDFSSATRMSKAPRVVSATVSITKIPIFTMITALLSDGMMSTLETAPLAPIARDTRFPTASLAKIAMYELRMTFMVCSFPIITLYEQMIRKKTSMKRSHVRVSSIRKKISAGLEYTKIEQVCK